MMISWRGKPQYFLKQGVVPAFILILILLSCPCTGQNLPVLNLTKRADAEFARFGYRGALDLYLQAYKSDSSSTYLTERIAQCYIRLNESKEAEAWLTEYLNLTEEPDSKYYYLLASQMIKNRKYEESKEWLEKAGDSQLVSYKLEGIKEVSEFLDDSTRYAIERMGFNSSQSDFGPMYYENGVAFVSSRQTSKWVRNTFNWDKSSYLDFYFVVPQDTVMKVTSVAGLNTEYHEGPGQLFGGGNKIVFTRNNYWKNRLSPSEQGVTELQIYFAKKDSSGRWVEIKGYPHNLKNHSFGHPTISENGRHMIFASNIPGGIGGTDLYYTTLLGDSSWTTPKNLGEQVNTAGDEMFPYLVGHKLFFASNGWPGLGGLDLYSVDQVNYNSFSKLVNLSAPINSSQDDFALITRDDMRCGYFSSDRAGTDDIYRFEAQFRTLPVIVKNLKDSTLLSDAVVYATSDASGGGSEKIGSNVAGEFVVELEATGSYSVFAEKPGFVLNRRISSDDYSNTGQVPTLWMYAPELELHAEDSENSTELEDPIYLVKALDETSQIIPEIGSSNIFRVHPNKHYEVVTIKKGYFTKRDTLHFTEELPLKTLFKPSLKKVVIGESIRLDHIYYDLNSAQLRPESMQELNNLVRFMQDNAHMLIELSSHSDSRGSAAYNKKLSQKRAESARNYLVSQGIDGKRVIPKGYGEEHLVNKCADGVKCAEEMHQENRRTEIKILKNE